MKAMYIKAPGQVEFKDIEMPVRKKGEVLYEKVCSEGRTDSGHP